jgi:aryl-alcohol dehydrogenase-like predicted oxidoreductase
MRYQLLGSSGLRVSELCLGTMTFGEEFGIGAGAAESRAVYDAFLAAGGNFLDTANIYNRGTSESLLGDFIGSERQRLVLASKYTLSTDPADPNAGGSHRKNLVQALEASLRRLKTEYLDLYWVHGWDPHTGIADLMRTLDDQVRLGKILHVGISNVPAWIVSAANTLAVARGLTPFTALQLHYNLVERSVEPTSLPMAFHFGMGVTAWSPLASGLLSGKYSAGSKTVGRLSGPRGARTMSPANLAAATAVATVAGEAGCTAAQAALAWMRQRYDGAILPILGARTLPQLQDNLGCLEVNLTAQQIAALDALAPPALVYPESLLAGDFFRTMMYGTVREQVTWSSSPRRVP